MILEFLPRTICLALASFFLVHLAFSLAVRLLGPAVVRSAARFRPHSAAQVLLSIRLLPPVCGFFAGVWSIFTYVWLERTSHPEPVGFVCLGAALLGILSLIVPQVRGWASMSKTLNYLRRCQHAGRVLRLPGERVPALVIEGQVPFFALVGVRNPRLVISAPVVGALSATELAAALRHERAHYFAMDNLKRIVVLLAPDLFPFYRGFRTLEAAWSRFIERAADDRAADGDSRRSLSLAAALVRMAQLGVCREAPAAVTPLLTQDQDLATRVNRLLDHTEPRRRPYSKGRKLWACCLMASVALTSVAAAQPASLRVWGNLLEDLHHVGLTRRSGSGKKHRRKRLPNAIPQDGPVQPAAAPAPDR